MVRILATNRESEGLAKPKRSPHQKREMPFEASYRHEIWTSDVRYVDHSIPRMGQAYVLSPSWTTTREPSSPARSRSPRTQIPALGRRAAPRSRPGGRRPKQRRWGAHAERH